MGLSGKGKGKCKIEKCWYRMRHSWLDACNFLFDLCESYFVFFRGQQCVVPDQHHLVGTPESISASTRNSFFVRMIVVASPSRLVLSFSCNRTID
jgi:hypothetical protein